MGFSYLGRGVSLHGCSSKAQPLLPNLNEQYLLTAAPLYLERGVAPLGLPVPTPLPLLGHWFSALPKNQEWMWIFNYISWGADLVDFYSVNVISY